MESALSFNPETGKPNPISLKEWYGMDRKTQRTFAKQLSPREQYDFRLVLSMAFDTLPKAKRHEVLKHRVDALQTKEHKSIGDRIDLVMTTVEMKRLELPAKPPIFLRKLRTEQHFPKWALEKKSPFFMKSV